MSSNSGMVNNLKWTFLSDWILIKWSPKTAHGSAQAADTSRPRPSCDLSVPLDWHHLSVIGELKTNGRDQCGDFWLKSAFVWGRERRPRRNKLCRLSHTSSRPASSTFCLDRDLLWNRPHEQSRPGLSERARQRSTHPLCNTASLHVSKSKFMKNWWVWHVFGSKSLQKKNIFFCYLNIWLRKICYSLAPKIREGSAFHASICKVRLTWLASPGR